MQSFALKRSSKTILNMVILKHSQYSLNWGAMPAAGLAFGQNYQNNQTRNFGGKLDKWAWEDAERGDKPSGAARGQTGTGGKAGSMNRSVFNMYDQLTPEQKRAAAKQRRLAKKGLLPKVDRSEVEKRVKTQLEVVKNGVESLVQENEIGHLTIEYTPETFSMVVTVKDVGPYTFQIDDATNLFQLISPVSGTYNYEFDVNNGFWMSKEQVHIMDELLSREFLAHTRGLLILN